MSISTQKWQENNEKKGKLYMTTIKKAELVSLLAEALETKKKEAEETLSTVFEVFADVIISQQKGIKLGEIGTVKVDVVPEREHRNPQTGESVTKPEHYALKFKASKPFKEELAEVKVQG